MFRLTEDRKEFLYKWLKTAGEILAILSLLGTALSARFRPYYKHVSFSISIMFYIRMLIKPERILNEETMKWKKHRAWFKGLFVREKKLNLADMNLEEVYKAVKRGDFK